MNVSEKLRKTDKMINDDTENRTDQVWESRVRCITLTRPEIKYKNSREPIMFIFYREPQIDNLNNLEFKQNNKCVSRYI